VYRPDEVLEKATKVLEALGFYSVRSTQHEDSSFHIRCERKEGIFVLNFNDQMLEYTMSSSPDERGYTLFLEAQIRTIMSGIIEDLMYGEE
jgi:hypothetical protein